MQIIADRLVADDHDRVHQIDLRPAGREESVGRLRRYLSPMLRDSSRETGERVEPSVERGPAAAKLSDLRLSEAEHLAERRVGGEAIVAVVDLAHSEVDRFTLLRLQGRLGVLQREIRAERGRRMPEGRQEVRDETECPLQIFEKRLVLLCDVVMG